MSLLQCLYKNELLSLIIFRFITLAFSGFKIHVHVQDVQTNKFICFSQYYLDDAQLPDLGKVLSYYNFYTILRSKV